MGHGFKENQRVLVPATEGFHDQGLEMDALCATIVEMNTVFRSLSHLDCGAGNVGGPKDNGVLDGGDNGDVKSNSATVYAIPDEYICWPRLGTGDETRHFLQRVEAGMLSLKENFVPYSVVSAAADSMVVVAM